jgi:hypothetical protein
MNELTAAGPGPGGPADGPPDPNRRGHPRRPCRYQALCRCGGRAWWPVAFVDLSVGGAGVALSSPVEVGAPVTFTVHAASGRLFLVRARVRRVEPRGGEWLAGCEFERRLSPGELADLA